MTKLSTNRGVGKLLQFEMGTWGYITQQIDDALSRIAINAHFPSFSHIETLEHKQYKKIVIQ